MRHAVGFGQRADHPCGIPRRKAVCGDVAGHNASRADHAIVPDCHARQDRCVRADPAILSDVHGLCVAEPFHLAALVPHPLPLVGKHRVNGGDDGDVRSEVAAVVDHNLRVVLHGQVEVDEHTFPDFRVLSVMKGHRALQKAPLAQFPEHFTEDLRALFGFVLVGIVIVDIQLMRAQFDCFQCGIAGEEQQSRRALPVLGHRSPLSARKVSTSSAVGMETPAPARLTARVETAVA